MFVAETVTPHEAGADHLQLPDHGRGALSALADAGEDGKVLAGGQSLIPMLNMRLASPAHLVDINGVAGLDTLDVNGDVRVGALARHARVEADERVRGVYPALRVVVADDQKLVRTGFRLILEEQDDIDVVGEAADGVAAVDVVRRLRPDVVLMDVRMPVLDGLEATRRLLGDGQPHPHPDHVRPR